MLRRVKIRGFKSFAGDVTLDLGPGLNVIVGPNGSGKSNFAEAIVWALGEQRAGKLRAPGMGDILYQGGAMRPPAGLAEVALQFDGDEDGPAEVEVGRRLTRAGDSHYRVNGASCRLLDLQETLSGRGLGTESLAVIRQGQVEALATSKPAERRAMLDEAAGVGVAKRRRRRAEQKLARVAEKLDRARDLAAELTSRARALERQARAAERAAALEAEILELRDTERAARAVAAAASLDRARDAFEERRASDQATQQALESARVHRAAETEARTRTVADLEAAELIAAALRATADRVTGRAELAAERLAELESRQERMGHARAEAASRLAELADLEAGLATELSVVAEALSATQAATNAAEEAEMAGRAAAAEAAEAVRRLTSQIAECDGAVTDGERRAAQAREAIDRAAATLGQMELDSPHGLERAERRARVSAERAQRDEAILTAATRRLEDATAELRAAEQRQREAGIEARRLAPDDESRPSATLGDGLVVEVGLEKAFAGALGVFADAPVAGGVPEARTFIDGGASAVIVPGPQRRAGEPVAGATPLAAGILECPSHTRPHIARLLADVWLVERLDHVPAGSAGTYVDRDGVVLRPGEGTVATSRGTWARRALHRRALEAVAVCEAEAARVQVVEADERAQRDRIQLRARASAQCAARANERLGAERAQAAARSERIERVRADLESAQQAASDATEVATNARARRDQLGHEIAGAQAELERSRQGAAAATAELERAQSQLREARSAKAVVDARAAEIQAQIAAARALVGAAETLPADLALVGRAVRGLLGLTDGLTPHVEGATARLTEARGAFSGAEERLGEAMRAVEAAQSAADEARELAHGAEVELRLAEERVAEAGPVPDVVPDEPVDPDDVAARLAELERRRIGIGAVDELAATERTELAEREQHLVEQIADLEQSGAALSEHLGELDNAVGEGFEAIFQTVSERFSEVVGLLFPGGTGRLRLVEPDEEGGDEGVEVEVVPAGKRPRALSLMSGGERSLIAMAFCLALALARPAPFYLLDEVEAALDDANLRRFLGVVRRLADETQFVVITHQQPTVEIADTLFGVTMGQDGATQVLSRKLARSVEGPARPYVRRQLRVVNS